MERKYNLVIQGDEGKEIARFPPIDSRYLPRKGEVIDVGGESANKLSLRNRLCEVTGITHFLGSDEMHEGKRLWHARSVVYARPQENSSD